MTTNIYLRTCHRFTSLYWWSLWYTDCFSESQPGGEAPIHEHLDVLEPTVRNYYFQVHSEQV